MIWPHDGGAIIVGIPIGTHEDMTSMSVEKAKSSSAILLYVICPECPFVIE